MTDDKTRLLELTNPWAQRMSPRNAERFAQMTWDKLDPDQRPPDGAAWADGFKAAMEFMWSGVAILCKENDRLGELAWGEASSPATPTSGTVPAACDACEGRGCEGTTEGDGG